MTKSVNHVQETRLTILYRQLMWACIIIWGEEEESFQSAFDRFLAEIYFYFLLRFVV
jgi:hypothetical protein